MVIVHTHINSFCSIAAIMDDDLVPVSARAAVIRNDDLLSYIFINWVDPRSCFAVCLVNRRFNALYRLRVPGPLCSSVSQHSSRVELVKWALGAGMDIHASACVAALHGHLHVLQYLYFSRQYRHAQLCLHAAEGGHLEVLQWLRSQDPPCDWSAEVCACAAADGHLEVLQWLRSQDPPCDWSERACAFDANDGHL
jgi:hypothetical protein